MSRSILVLTLAISALAADDFHECPPPENSTGCIENGGDCEHVFIASKGICVVCTQDTDQLLTKHMASLLTPPAEWCKHSCRYYQHRNALLALFDLPECNTTTTTYTSTTFTTTITTTTPLTEESYYKRWHLTYCIDDDCKYPGRPPQSKAPPAPAPAAPDPAAPADAGKFDAHLHIAIPVSSFPSQAILGVLGSVLIFGGLALIFRRGQMQAHHASIRESEAFDQVLIIEEQDANNSLE